MQRLLRWGTGLVALVGIVAATAICLVGVHDDIHRSDVAIVLGSKVTEEGTPSVHLALRLDRALALYQAGIVPRIIVSGGPGVAGHSEPAVMRDYLIARGVPAGAIISDPAGINTAATAHSALTLMTQRGFRSALIVTEYFHMPRTRLAFARQGVKAVHYAHAGYPLPRDLWAIAREVIGLPLYWLGMRPIAAEPMAGATAEER